MGDEPNAEGDPTPPPAGEHPQWDAQTRAYIENLRQENAKHRTRNKVLESSLGKLQDSAATIRKLSIDNHLLSKGIADPKLIRFYLSEENQLDDLDPSVDDWTTLLDDRVNDLIGRHPEIKQGRSVVPIRSSSGASGGGGNNMPATAQLTRNDAMRMSPEEVAAAFQSGHFNQLLGRRP